MFQLLENERTSARRYALCVGIGTYTNLPNRNLRYAARDATDIAERLADPQRGNFAVTLVTTPAETTKTALETVVNQFLSVPEREADDLVVLYFSCHGDIHPVDSTFCLLPSNATRNDDGVFDQTTLISLHDLARWFSQARTQHIIVLLDVCHSGGAGAALQQFKLNLDAGPNYFIIGAARQDQVTQQSSVLEHGIFTHCLLRAFEQPPTKDGWLTIAQIHTYVSEEMQWFAKDQPTQIQSWSVTVNPQLPLVRNPGYPELSPVPPLWNVPVRRNPFFTEQANKHQTHPTLLRREQRTVLTQPYALSGLGGIGKTQLALEYAYRYRQDYHAVLWGRADTREALISTFVSIAHLLDLPQKDEQDQMQIVQAVKTWLTGRSQWLLILDNADELALVEEFIPPAFRGHLLLTTRAQVMGELAQKFEVVVMQPEIGALLLLRRARRIGHDAPLEKASSSDVRIAKDLSKAMGGLPLALDQAGAYIEATSCSLVKYQRLYQLRRAELLTERGGVRPDHPDAVATTWSLAFQKVEQANPAAGDLLRIYAYLDPDAIPEELIAGGAKHLGPWLQEMASDSLVLDKAITALRAYSLLARDPQTQMLSIHRLVQAVLRDRMPTEIQQQWMQRAVLTVDAVFPSFEFTNWPTCERLLPNGLICTTWIEHAQFVTLPTTNLLDKIGSYLSERGQYEQAEPLYVRALAIREQQLGAEHPDTAISLNNLALLYTEQGKYEQAEPLYVRALAIREQQLGTEHPDTANSLNNLALLYDDQGKHEQAEPLYVRALAIREQQLGAEHPDTATSLNNLALLYQSQGKYEQAEPLHTRALAIREQQLGAEHPSTANSLNTLAMLYRSQGKYGQAEPLLVRALAIREQQVGAEHPDTATSLNNLAMLYRSQGKNEQAEPLLVRALAIYEQQLGAQHPSTASILNNLAMLYRSQKKYEQAESLFIRALAIYEQQLGAQHSLTATSLNNLALLYQSQGKYEQAEPLFIRALAICEQLFGEQHPNTANTLNNLAMLYRSQEKYEQAELLFIRALAIYENLFGQNHPHTQTILTNYTVLLEAMKLVKKPEA